MSERNIKTVAVIGAGDMGHGIAEVALMAGHAVWLQDITEDLTARLERMAKDFSKVIFEPTAMIREGGYL